MSSKAPIRVPASNPATAFLSMRPEPAEEVTPTATPAPASREQEAPARAPSSSLQNRGQTARSRARPKWQGRTLYLTDAAAELIESERLRRLKTPEGRADRSIAEYSVIVCDAVVSFLGSARRA